MLDYLLQIIPTIADGLKVTVSLFCIVWILSIPGGILLALVRLSKFTRARQNRWKLSYI